MIPWIRRIWNDPVWSKVIAAAVVATLVGCAGYFLDWWHKVWAAITAALSFFAATTPIWNGVIALTIVIVLVETAIIVRIIQRLKVDASQSESNWREYTRDTFFGGDFRWRFFGTGGDITDLHCCCPECQYQVFAHHGRDWQQRVYLRCDECGWEKSIDVSPDDLQEKIQLLVQQKLRTGDWLDAVRANSQPPSMRIGPPRAGA